MSDYIKRSDAKIAIDNFMFYIKLGESVYDAYGTAVDDLECQPAADVRENVRGEWLNYNYNEKMCSNCKARQLWMNAAVYQYCPHCGADMRGGEDG